MGEKHGSSILLTKHTFHACKVLLHAVNFNMPHHNQSIRERVITLVEEGNLTAAEAGRRYDVPDRTAKRWIERYRETGETSMRAGTGYWRVSSQAEDARLVEEARENPFLNYVQ
jgi:transposase